MSFSPSAKFQGSRSGYVFKLDSLGLGYYRDGVIGQDEEKLEVSHTHDKVHNQQRERHRDRSVTDTESDRRRRSSRSRSPHRDSLSSERQQAQSGKVSFEESDEFAPEITAVMLAERQLEMFNARRLVPFLECFHSDLIVEVEKRRLRFFLVCCFNRFALPGPFQRALFVPFVCRVQESLCLRVCKQ